MHQVVHRGAEFHIDCIANHEDVRDKDKRGEEPPAKMPMSVERHRCCKNCCSFRMQQPTRTRQHERVSPSCNGASATGAFSFTTTAFILWRDQNTTLMPCLCSEG